MKALILGATGYTGMLLLRILAHHPAVERITAASRSLAGHAVAEYDSGLSERALEKIDPVGVDPAAVGPQGFDVVFSALPHGASAELCARFAPHAVVVDLSADFRFADEARFVGAYGHARPFPDLQSRAVFGLTEWRRAELRAADLIANPGCYPTATLLPLLPLAEAGLIRGTVHVTAMSGISGAGKKEAMDLLLCERTENVNAYNPGRKHRHHAEIEEKLAQMGGATTGAADDPAVLFTPYLVPIKQGMAITSTVRVADPVAAVEALRARYAHEPFIRLTGETTPQTRHVRGTNRIAVGWRAEGPFLILMSVIDNLWKGASGQAVQNVNVRFGLDETAGLVAHGEL